MESSLCRALPVSRTTNTSFSNKVYMKERIQSTLRKLYFHFLSNWMGYDGGDSFPFDFGPNEIQFGSKSKGKLSPRSYPIHCERKWKYSFLCVFSLSPDQRSPAHNAKNEAFVCDANHLFLIGKCDHFISKITSTVCCIQILSYY